MMTLQEKAAQMVMGWQVEASPYDVAKHGLGGVLSNADSAAGATDREHHGDAHAQPWAKMVDQYHAAARRSRHHIPLLYGIDAVHGNSKTLGATIFPHPIGLGCTRDEQLVERIGVITAKETAAIGVDWTFAPAAIVAIDERWGRTYESFSEEPELTGQLAAAMVRGLQQGFAEDAPSVVACAKHFAGDGLARPGTSTARPSWTSVRGILDRGNAEMPEFQFRSLAVDHYRPIIDAGVASIMVSFSSWNGDKAHGNAHLITDILKGELGFSGIVVGGYEGHQELPGDHADQVVAAFNAGIDMLTEPVEWQKSIGVIAGEAGKRLPMARIDDAVSRILGVKCEAGLFKKTRNPSLMATIGVREHRAVAREAVRQSLVLLKNEGAGGRPPPLPLQPRQKVFLSGSGAADLGRQTGGQTITWQGSGRMTTGTTIKTALERETLVVTDPREADVNVVVLAEPPYAEWFGDDMGLEFEAADVAALTEAHKTGKPTVAIMYSGRPMIITGLLGYADAWIAAWLPGTEGDGITDVLFGDYAPSGKLSHTWPKAVDQIPVDGSLSGANPLFPYGYGLTY